MTSLKPPFGYFGSKRAAATAVWAHLGDPAIYIEPFAGSIAVLLARPDEPRMEVIADADPFLINFWRCLRSTDGAAYLSEHRLGPISESEIEAWHRSLVAQRATLADCLAADIEWHSPIVALRWWIGMSSWIGSGWCRSEHPDNVSRQRPHIDGTLKGAMSERMCTALIAELQNRLRKVVMIGGDWQRCVTPGILNRFRPKRGAVGIFLDPPYTHATGRVAGLYGEDSALSEAVQDFAFLTASRNVRIVVAGYENEYPGLLAAGWVVQHWNRPSGYVNNSGNDRRQADVLFLSPH